MLGAALACTTLHGPILKLRSLTCSAGSLRSTALTGRRSRDGEDRRVAASSRETAVHAATIRRIVWVSCGQAGWS